jgi:hypothetical protein
MGHVPHIHSSAFTVSSAFSFPVSDVEWARPGTEIEHQLAFQQLRESHLLMISQNTIGEYQVQLRSIVREMLLRGCAPSPGAVFAQRPPLFADSSTPGLFDRQQKKIELTDLATVPYISESILDFWSSSQLQNILLWMLELRETIDPDIRQLLVDSQLIKMDNSLTEDGNQFVLEDPRSQMWKLFVWIPIRT